MSKAKLSRATRQRKTRSAEKTGLRAWLWRIYSAWAEPEDKEPVQPRAVVIPNVAPAVKEPEPESDLLHPFAKMARLMAIEIPVEPPLLEEAELEADEQLATLIRELHASTQLDQAAFPAVAMQILDLVAKPEADISKLASLVSQDPALSAGVMSVANSVLFRGVSEIETVREAVTRLGVKEVGQVAIAVSTRTLFNPQAQADRAAYGAQAALLFSRSVAIGLAGAALAMRQRGARSDRVYLAGLLHDVGKALGLRALSRRPDVAAEPARLERALDAVHVELGVEAMKAWGLPQYLSAICALHHQPQIAAAPDNVDLHLVRLTSALSQLNEPLFAFRASREILQSAEALKMDAYAVRALNGELKQALLRSEALPK